MSEQKQKRPAHEVILAKLAEMVRAEMENITESGRPSGFGYFPMEALCQVLAEMIIPENQRTIVSSTLWGLAQEYRGGEINIVTGLLRSTGDVISGDK